jgi:phosphate transport system permease protein
VIEVLAGIPTDRLRILRLLAGHPLLKEIIPSLGAKNALSPGIVMGS